MNAISTLLGLTALILVGVLVFSFSSMQDGNPKNIEEKERLRRELAMLEHRTYSLPTPTVKEPEADASEMEELKAELEALKAEQSRAEAERLAQVEQEPIEEEEIEPEMHPEDEKRLKRRANLIAQAMVMATVETYYPPPDGFATIQIINYENVQSGVTLAIRRNTGIVGQLVVSTVESEKAVADVLDYTFLGGEVDIQPGDELILPPL